MKIKLSQLKRIIKEEARRARLRLHESHHNVLDSVYEAWGFTGGFEPGEGPRRQDVAKDVLEYYGFDDGGKGYIAFIEDFTDMLGDEDLATGVADDIWSPKYLRVR